MTSYNKLAEQYEYLSFKVGKMGEVLINRQISEALTPDQHAVLRFIFQEGACTASDLSKSFYVEKSAITAIINRLDKKELIKRERSETDRRIVYLTLTDKGAALYHEASEKINQLVESFISHFDKEEIEVFLSAYQKLADILEAEIKAQKGEDR